MEAGRQLSGKAAVVTGSTSGIGLGIAKALAAEGASVMLNGLGEASAIEDALREVRGVASAPVEFSPANMLEPGEIEAMIETAADRFGSVDILVNNAGIQHVSPIQDFPVEKWNAIIGAIS